MLMTPNATALDNELLKVSLSPIAALLDDPHVTDIMVYGSQHVYSRGRRSGFERVPVSWLSDEDLMTAAKTIGRQMNRRLDHREPILDAKAPRQVPSERDHRSLLQPWRLHRHPQISAGSLHVDGPGQLWLDRPGWGLNARGHRTPREKHTHCRRRRLGQDHAVELPLLLHRGHEHRRDRGGCPRNRASKRALGRLGNQAGLGCGGPRCRPSGIWSAPACA